MRSTPAVAAPPAGASASKSWSQLACARSSVRQKKIDVPSGAATAARSASAGPRSRPRTGASSASARWAERAGSALSTAIAAMPLVADAPALSSTRASARRHSVTGLVRCWAAWEKPSACSTRWVSPAEAGSTASSANA